MREESDPGVLHVFNDWLEGEEQLVAARRARYRSWSQEASHVQHDRRREGLK